MTTPNPRYTFLSFLLIAFAVYYSFHSDMPQELTEEKIPVEEFSTVRAFTHVNKIGQKPHYVGSKAHAEVRKYILSELKQLGLDPIIQEGFTLDNSGNISKPKNILARIKGKNSTKALLLLSHYDSDPHSAIGASDAASGVATILEGTRAFLAKGEQPENDIILVLSDGEELGLNGAELFVNKHPWAKDVGLVLNFEARGSGGPSIMLLETNAGNAKLIKAFQNANLQYPVGNSLAYSIYKKLPNDTDLTVFREDGNIQGFNFAFIDDHYDYHTANDTPENLDFNTLTHQGAYLMPLLDYFSKQDLTQITTDEDLIYFNSPLGFHTYPISWIVPMLILIVLLFIGVLFYGFKENMLSQKGVLQGFVSFFIALIASCGLTFIGWLFISWLYPQYAEIQHGFPYNGHTYITLFALFALGITFYSYYKFGKKTTAANLSIAPLFLWVVISILAALYLDGASFITIPVLFMLLSLFILIKQKNTPTTLLYTILALPAIFILSPFIKLFPVGLGLKIIIVVPLLVVLIIGLLMPVFGLYKRPKWTARMFFLLTIIAFFVAHSRSDFTEERQKPNSLVYVLDADAQKASWNTYDGILDDWTRNYIKEGEVSTAKNVMDSKYKAKFTYTQAAPVKQVSMPLIETIKDTTYNNLRHVDVKITSQRAVNRMEVFSNETKFTSAKVNGMSLKYPNNTWNRLTSYYVSDNEPLVLSFTVQPNAKPELILYEASFDLMENPLFSIPARAKNMMPRPFVLNDAIIVKKTIGF
ncbi:aminopeptidase S [Kordia sp. SMS9]|uniref:M28 family peptidase n=1 Tax=Kordia sp. SMS9 TaxID=2282170 RepID=UPI000E0DD24F|nr:M28 family peptidase [Kordia sp. SMS9]AXG68580.1 aminopeptidase S [Kordia sp. SMS9]